MRALSATRAATLALVALAGCGLGPEPGPASGAEAAARELFALAEGPSPEESRLLALFGAEAVREDRAALLDALAALGGARFERLAALETLAGEDEVAVDLAAELPRGGSALYSAVLQRPPGGAWRVRWFQGPGVEWPKPAARRGDGLSVSAAPD